MCRRKIRDDQRRVELHKLRGWYLRRARVIKLHNVRGWSIRDRFVVDVFWMSSWHLCIFKWSIRMYKLRSRQIFGGFCSKL